MTVLTVRRKHEVGADPAGVRDPFEPQFDSKFSFSEILNFMIFFYSVFTLTNIHSPYSYLILLKFQ